MAKLTQDRDTKHRGTSFVFEAGKEIFCCGMMALNASGKLVMATAGETATGMAQQHGEVEDSVFNKTSGF